jgi:hypothetical protein
MSFPYPTSTRMTTRAVDKLQLERRRQEYETASIHQFTKTNQIQSLHIQSDANVATRRRSNQIAQLTAERMLEETHAQQRSAAARHQRELQQNEQLAHAMEKAKKQTEQKEREIQRICESSEELRELEALLKTAYMNKDRAAQQAERHTLEVIDRTREVAIEQQMEYDRQCALVEAQNKELAKRADAVHAKSVLQTQMVERQELRREAEQEAERERQKIEQLMQQIELEDAEEIARRESHRDATREMIRRTQIERERALQMQAEHERAEEERIAAYRRQVESREAGVKALSDRKKAEDDARFRAVESEIRAKMRADHEIEQLRDELWEEEMLQKKKQQEEEKALAKLRAKDEMMHSNAVQLRLKHELLARQQQEEDAFNAMLMKKFQSEARRDAEMAAFKRKQKEEYKQEILRHNAIKQQMLHEELQREQRDRECQEKDEAYRRQVIEQAKQRLLQEHADVLQGYLPRAAALHQRPSSSSSSGSSRPSSGRFR